MRGSARARAPRPGFPAARVQTGRLDSLTQAAFAACVRATRGRSTRWKDRAPPTRPLLQSIAFSRAISSALSSFFVAAGGMRSSAFFARGDAREQRARCRVARDHRATARAQGGQEPSVGVQHGIRLALFRILSVALKTLPERMGQISRLNSNQDSRQGGTARQQTTTQQKTYSISKG